MTILFVFDVYTQVIITFKMQYKIKLYNYTISLNCVRKLFLIF